MQAESLTGRQIKWRQTSTGPPQSLLPPHLCQQMQRTLFRLRTRISGPCLGVHSHKVPVPEGGTVHPSRRHCPKNTNGRDAFKTSPTPSLQTNCRSGSSNANLNLTTFHNNKNQQHWNPSYVKVYC